MIALHRDSSGFMFHNRKMYLFGFRKERFGWKFVFPLGFELGFVWHYCDGESSKSSASLFSWHHPKSITWRFSFAWVKPSKWFYVPKIKWHRTPNGYNWYSITLPMGGSFTLNTQEHMWRRDGIGA
jgi:hypothetical protein